MISSRLARRDRKLRLLILFACCFVWAHPRRWLNRLRRRMTATGAPNAGTRWEIWTGAGADPIGTPRVTLGNGVWTVGVRYGWILTDAHGPGFLRGRFEYAVDALPVVMVFQPGGQAYGFGFDPWIMKWNFETHHRISPYIELGGGALISTRQIPLGEKHSTSRPPARLASTFFEGNTIGALISAIFIFPTRKLRSSIPAPIRLDCALAGVSSCPQIEWAMINGFPGPRRVRLPGPRKCRPGLTCRGET